MSKTKSQVLYVPIKKEECEYKSKFDKSLPSINNASSNKNKSKRYRISKTKVVIRSRLTKDRSENEQDNKQATSKPIAISKRPIITNEQIAKLISYIINDKMNLKAASKKAGMSLSSGRTYYRDYQNDPEHKIPSAKSNVQIKREKLTQKQISDMIHYVVNDKMSMTQASFKANIDRNTASRYYAEYLKNPNRLIPPPIGNTRRYTLEEIKQAIGYIVHDNMSLAKASKKAHMTTTTLKKYYLKYLEDPNHQAPVPEKHPGGGDKRCTNDQVKLLISCIVDQGMPLLEASIKANMSGDTARKYYRQYAEDPNHKIPTPDTKKYSGFNNRTAIEEVRLFFNFIIVDKLTVKQASKKANIPEYSGYRLYKKYLENPTKEVSAADNTYSVEKMKKFVNYVQKDKMSMTLAAAKANLNDKTARKYYRQYLEDPEHKFPTIDITKTTPEDIKKLISYVENDKMSITSAGKKINMFKHNALRYYQLYKNDPEHRIPAPILKEQKRNHEYSQILADIYKNNPWIKPPSSQHHLSYSDKSEHGVKLEPLEQDTKTTIF